MVGNDPVKRTDAAPETTAAERKRFPVPWNGIFLVLFGIGMLGYVGYFAYGYWLGTPATATVGHCELGGLLRGWAEDSARYCDGSWRTGGQSQTGPIRPAFWSHDAFVATGSSLDVHVNDGTAYRWFGTYFYLGVTVGPILIIWEATSLWRKRRNP